MKIFVINMKRSIERRAFMHKQLINQNLDFEFVQAVDGAALTDDYLSRICDYKEMAAKRPWLLKRGVYGCLLSHLSIYKDIIANNIPFALVLEDDVEISDKLKSKLDKIGNSIREGEVILLFLQNNHTNIVFSEQHAISLGDAYQLVYPMSAVMLGSAAGYVVTKQAAQCLVDMAFPIRYAADDWGAFYEEKAVATVRCVTPFLVKPAGLKSNIDYIKNSGVLGKIMNFVDKKNMFPFKQFLKWRRKLAVDKTSAYSFDSALSLLDNEL